MMTTGSNADRLQIFTDNPITSANQDKFGFDRYANVLKQTILQTGPLPFSVGIFGAWGSGKTSFMKLIQEKVSTEGVKCIWFNPWKYDKKEDLWNSLIQTILYSILEGSDNPEIKNNAKNLALATTWLALKKSISAFSAGLITEANIDAVITSLSKEDELYYRHINSFEADFEKVVDRYTQQGKLIIFIDDLDRCLPENAITVLEALKLFIGNAKCIFVLGIDHYVVEEGIKSRFTGKSPLNGRDYLDKIIQIPFFLPPVPFQKLKDSCTASKNNNALSDKIWNIVHLGMEGNPRKTKRFINCFYLLQQLLADPERRGQTSGTESAMNETRQNTYIAEILVFQMSFPDFYRHLQLHPGNWEYLETELIQQDDQQQRERALRLKPELEPFWNDEYFRAFIRQATKNEKDPPSPDVVTQLLQITNLVQDSSQPKGPDFPQPKGRKPERKFQGEIQSEKG